MAGKAKAEQPATTGRPTIFSQELADRICEELALGKSMRTVCKADDMPALRTVFYWLRSNEEFLQQYARAKEEAADAQADELLDLGDEAVTKAEVFHGPQASAIVQAYKLKTDNIKWLMSKAKPKKYGDKLDMTTDGKALPAPLFGGLSVNLNAKDDD